MGSRLTAILLAVAGLAAPAQAPAARSPLGILSPVNGNARTLVRLDPLTLRPAGPRLRLGEYHNNWSLSPDRTRVALGLGGQGKTCARGVCIVDLATMRIAAYVPAPTAVEAVAWLKPRRIVAVLQTGGILVADPMTGRILRSRPPLPFEPFGPSSARTRGGLAVVMNARPFRLLVADARGGIRVAPLRRFPRAPGGAPGLAFDPDGRRAIVVAPGAPIAEVNLRTMRVRYHRVGLPPLRRPPRGRELLSHREALWLGHGLVAVFGDDQVRGPGGRLHGTRTFAAGVHVIDTRSWTARTVAQGGAGARVAAGRLLVYTSYVSAAPGVGLRVYTRDGSQLVSHLLGNQVLDVEVAGARAYAYRRSGRSRALHVVHARSGKLIRRASPPRAGLEVDILDG
jgi:hypothetical protein